jgi:dienelactone hydrolase
MREKDNDPRAFDLYDDDCHGRIDRRTFFGRARATAEVPKIRAPMLVHLAEDDQRVSATWPDSEAALKATGVSYESYAYTGADFTTNSGVEARAWQGARRANSHSIEPTSNAVRRDGSALEMVKPSWPEP